MHIIGYIENMNPFLSSRRLPSGRGGRGFGLASLPLPRPVHALVPSLVPPLDLPGLPAGQPARQPAGGGGRGGTEARPGGLCIPTGH